MRKHSLISALLGLGVAIFVACSADPPLVKVGEGWTPYGGSSYTGIHDRVASASPVSLSMGGGGMPQGNAYGEVRQSASSLYGEIRVERDYLPYGARGRSRRGMNPRYVTIHSTQNWSRGADSLRHSVALKRGALGRLSWHFTVDDKRAVQHLPTNEQGNHADFAGPGNKYSIGIEMCEHPGNSRSATLERTAKLAAWLCVQHDIPVSNVVPHYNWPRRGMSPPNKNCPHFLLDNGRPGSKWRGFVRAVEIYHRKMTGR